MRIIKTHLEEEAVLSNHRYKNELTGVIATVKNVGSDGYVVFHYDDKDSLRQAFSGSDVDALYKSLDTMSKEEFADEWRLIR